MAKANPVEAVPFTNDLGQVINPGDPVLVITCRSHHVSVTKGKYIGSRAAPSGYGKDHRNVQVEIQEPIRVMRHKVTGEKMASKIPGFEWDKWPKQPYRPEYAKTNRPSWVQYGHYDTPLTPEEHAKYNADLDKYNEWTAAYRKATELYRAEHHEVNEIRTYKKTLQCNRIYPLGISMDEFIKVI